MRKEIPDFPGYSISDRGAIFSMTRRLRDGRMWKGRQLCVQRRQDGHLTVCLYQEGKQRRMLLHRLVLSTFVGRCPPGMEGCHNNGIANDNRLCNLRWGTRSSNAKDAVKHGTSSGLKRKGIHQNVGQVNGSAKLSTHDVRSIIYAVMTQLFSHTTIALWYDISRSTVSMIALRQTWRHLWIGR